MSKEKYEPINTAREDQKTVTFVCHDCGSLVRSDYADVHDRKCGMPAKKGRGVVSNMTARVLELVDERRKSVSSSTEIWRFPEPGKSYILAAYPCTGSDGGGNAAIEVIDAETGEQCAEFAAVVSPEDLALIILDLAQRYNNAEVAVEVNGVGQVTNNILVRQYGNVYRWKHLDEVNQTMTDHVGWRTTTKTKALMESIFRESVEKNPQLLNSVNLITEILAYDEDGCEENERFSAMMIAQAVRAEKMLAV